MSRELPVWNKPEKGEPCNNCGYCCHEETCGISDAVFGNDGRTPCTALEIVGDKFLCGLVRSPTKYLPNLVNNDELKEYFVNLVSNSLGMGQGCDADYD